MTPIPPWSKWEPKSHECYNIDPRDVPTSTLKSLELHIACELTECRKNPAAVVLTLAMPILFYAIYGFAYHNHTQTIMTLHSLPIIATNRYFVASLAFTLTKAAGAIALTKTPRTPNVRSRLAPAPRQG